MELKRFILLSRDPVADSSFFEMLGMKRVIEGAGWSALALEGPEGPVELLSYQPLDGFDMAPGFEVNDVDAIYRRFLETGLRTTEIVERAWGRYFFGQDNQGRFWQFYQPSGATDTFA